MARHTHQLDTHVPLERIWEFVRDMDRWAPLLLGYQSHQKCSERESLWTLRGDLGALSRSAQFRVRITHWSERERVRFELEGVVEPVRGDGSFELERLSPASPASAPATAARPGLFARLWAWLARRWLGRGRAAPERSRRSAPDVSRLTFSLSLTPSGPMAPMLEAMLAPVMIATAEDLAQRIVAELEASGIRPSSR